jgi:hypothetical protein
MSRGLVVAVALALLGSVLSCHRSTDLVVGGIYSIADGSGRFGIAKLLARGEGFCGDDTFRAWQPVLIMKTPVTSEELEGYRMWKEARGGAF